MGSGLLLGFWGVERVFVGFRMWGFPIRTFYSTGF